MKKGLAVLLWFAGLAVLIGLLAHHGFGDVRDSLATVGWGLLSVTAFYVVVLASDARCWYTLIPPASRPPFLSLLWKRWICGAVNGLLPVAQVGGDVVRTRLATAGGLRGEVAGASVVTDITIGVATQVIFSIPGILLLIRYDRDGPAPLLAVVGVALFSLLLGGFFLAQHLGLFHALTRGLERMVGRGAWPGIIGGAQALDAAIVEIYRRRRDLLFAAGWRLAGWVAGAGEVWLALWFLGHPLSVLQALMLESLGQAVRSAGFIIPGALGIQEGGYIVLGIAVGLDPDTGLALSLVKRVRELLLGLPALLVWQVVEGRRLLVPVTTAPPATEVGSGRAGAAGRE